ncbi:uncharacterized protein FOMMEDRAFT_88129, partial [Fomitiporia mediterranea MF3/22]|uniref:uncharacterized protein n=1 Tax=Fomitiporia mediterranea (strain MF3/22) TaxID=694068 RepID=UPI0004409612
CIRNYTVKAGDTCTSICETQNVSTFQLAHNNPGVINEDCTNLQPDEVLCLGRVNQDCTINTRVNSGDTCSSIAEAEGISLEILEDNNPGICDSLEAGQVIPLSFPRLVSPSNKTP